MIKKPAVFAILILLFAVDTNAQEKTELREHYLRPPEAIAEEALAPRHRNVYLNDLDPSAEYFLNPLEAGELLPLSLLAKPHHNIAGLQIDPQANRARWMTTQSTNGLELIGARDGEARPISTPDGAMITTERWSPDGSRLAYLAHFNNSTHIYVANLSNGRSRRLTNQPVLATRTGDIQWSADGSYIFTVLVPRDRGEAPSMPRVPGTPQVKMTSSKENRLRTYQSLLKNRHEADLLEYHITGQLARINTGNRRIHRIGKPAMIESFDASPSGEYVIVQTVQKPFPYIVPYYRFGWVEEIWDMEGNVLTELRKSEASLGIPDHEETEDYGRSDIEWRPDGNGLSLILEPEEEKKDTTDTDDGDDGDNDDEEDKEEEEKKDKMYSIIQWLPPFGDTDMDTVYTSKRKMQGVSYSPETDILFIWENRNREEHLYAVFTDQSDTTYTIYRHKSDDFYKDPGNLMRKPGRMGETVVRLSPNREHVYLSGTQRYEDYDEKAPRPFIDRVTIQTGEKERIFQSAEDVYEDVTAVLDDQMTEIVLERESPEMHPDAWLYNTETGERTKLTDNRDYNEAVTGAVRHRFKVERADSFRFWVEVVLPKDWNGERLPGYIWHYPTEYDDQEDYDERARRHNINDFPNIYSRSPEILTKRGYAIIRADWPIAGRRGTSNDNFVWSIVQNSTAVIDSADARGYIDRSRMAIGGHSYGAFGTANALIHTSFFKAGIAGDGNFNRTLTPLGFQREPKDLWRAQDRYLQMSPLFWADRIDGALLMYHGEEDQNVGTWPTNSRRMFHAMNGIGKTAAMYMYPYEGHGPDAEETIMDLWTRMSDWLDHYVKNAGDHVPEAELGED